MPSVERPHQGAAPVTFSVLRSPSPSASCTCEHWLHCRSACHARDGDPAETSCDLAFLPDDGGLTRWGCSSCTPGLGAPHLLGWSVPLEE